MGLISGLFRIVTKIVEAISTVIETVGNAVQDGLDWVSEKVPILSPILSPVGQFVSTITSSAAKILNGIASILEGLSELLIDLPLSFIFRINDNSVSLKSAGLKLLGGLILLGAGIGDIIDIITGSSFQGAILRLVLFAGIFIFLFATGALGILASIIISTTSMVAVNILSSSDSDNLKSNKKRKLSNMEKADLKLVFGNSLNLIKIRIVENYSGIFSSIEVDPWPALTLGNIIYVKSIESPIKTDLLVHETTHCWQYQNIGPSYAGDSSSSSGESKYDWRVETDDLNNTNWLNFTAERQAKFLQDVWNCDRPMNSEFGTGQFYKELFLKDRPTKFENKRGNEPLAKDFTSLATNTINIIQSF